MKFILGTKQAMTQYFDEQGRAYAATLISAGPVVITQVKNKEKDGYEALQYGYGTKRASLISKPLRGHFKENNFRYVSEALGASPEAKVGDTVTLSVFSKGESIDVSGVSKGKGFQGVVKRHRFSGGPRSHGQKHSEREAGSIGGGARAGGRVAKGMRMPGRMGGDRVTVKNIVILDVNETENLLLVKGAVPGRRGTLLEIRGSVLPHTTGTK